MTDSGIRLIKEFEGFHSTAYADPLHGWSVPTIGYGTTVYSNGQKVRRGDRITEEQGLKELRHFLETKVNIQLKKIPYYAEMSEQQVGALQSFAYNLGAHFYGSDGFNTITRKLKNKEWETMREAFLLYVNPGSNVEAGLRRRRSMEASMWEEGLKRKIDTQRIGNFFGPEKLQDFFKWFDANNPNHVEAVNLLYPHLGTVASDDAAWVKKFREPIKQPEPEANKDLNLTVIHYSQRDSRYSHQAHRMCFSSSCAMLLKTLRPNAINGPQADDDYLVRVLKYGDTTIASAQVQALRSYGLECEFRQDLGWDDIHKQLMNGRPVPIGILHQGHVSRPSGGGHWIIVRGVTSDGSAYYVNDPYGELDLINGVYVNIYGENLLYSKKNLEKRWLVGEPGWGIIAK